MYLVLNFVNKSPTLSDILLHEFIDNNLCCIQWIHCQFSRKRTDTYWVYAKRVSVSLSKLSNTRGVDPSEVYYLFILHRLRNKLSAYINLLSVKPQKSKPAHHETRTRDLWYERPTLYLCTSVFHILQRSGASASSCQDI